MKNKILYLPVIFLVFFLLQACKPEISVDFQYSPLQPKVGQAVTFVNLVENKENHDFDWNFGDNGISIAKDPVKTYRLPGEYAVTLRVDSNRKSVKTKYITIYDSIPTIMRNYTQVNYYEEVKFSALAYNPLNKKKTYKWYFSKNAVGKGLTEEDSFLVSTEESPVIYFTGRGEEKVGLTITIGDSMYTKEQVKDSFIVNDVPTRSLLMARKDSVMLRQRIFDKGTEAPTRTNIPSGSHPFNMLTHGDYLYVFDAGSNIAANVNWESDNSGDGSIRVINLNTGTVESIINNGGMSSYFGFYNGFVDNKYVYWTDRNEFVYRLAKSERGKKFEWKGNTQNEVDYYLVRADSLGIGKDTYNGGIYFYDNVYFWGKGGAEKGIYRFTQNDIKQKQLSLNPILTDYAVRAFAIDRVNAQLYFSYTTSTEVGISVSNMDGTNVRPIEKLTLGDDELQGITGIVVDNYSGNLFWAYRAKNDGDESGVKQIKLVNAYSKPDRNSLKYFSKAKGVYGIALDPVKK